MINKHRKKIMLVAIISLLASGFLPFSFNNKKPGKDRQVSQTQLCCCGNNASCCQDCSCSEGLVENDYYSETGNSQESGDTGKRIVTITSCGGSSNDTFIPPELNYFASLSSFVNYLPVITSSEAITLKPEDFLLSLPYKPPKTQFLPFSHSYLKTTLLT